MGRIPMLVRALALAPITAALTPAAASAWMPEPVQFSRAVPLHARGAHTPAGAAAKPATTARPLTAAVTTRRRFDMVAAEWRGARATPVKLRVRLASGHWSRWADAGPGDD